MRGRTNQPPVYVVYPAALFDGWEVVRERDEMPVCFESRAAATGYANARAAMAGGGVVKIGNWFGDTETLWEVRPYGANQSTVPLS
jgi:hypothetical protein